MPFTIDMPAWSARAKAHVVLLPTGTHFTADDLSEAVGLPEEPQKVGAIFNTWQGQGLIRRTEFMVPSTREASKGAKVAIWERVRR